MAKHKCFFCGKFIEEGENEVPYKNRYAHTVCFNNSMKMLTKDKKEKLNEAASKKKKKAPKPKAELKNPMSEEDYQEKKRFFDYIRSYYLDNEEDKLPAKVYVLAEKYIEQYGYTYESMYKTLVYMREIKCMDLHGDAVGMIPYLSDEAVDYYTELVNVEENNKDIDVSKMYRTKSVVVLPKFQRRNNLIDIESL